MKLAITNITIFTLTLAIASMLICTAIEPHGHINKMQNKKNNASFVLIGNSLLGEGIDEALLSKLMNEKTAKIWSGGSASAWWYLATKNIALKPDPPAKAVVIFFRDTFLTRPTFRVHGKYKTNMRKISLEHEPEVKTLAYAQKWAFIHSYLNKYIPVYRHREATRNKIETEIKRFVSRNILRNDYSEIPSALSRVFRETRMQKQLYRKTLADAEKQDESEIYTDFKEQLSKSFLPLIVDMCKRNNTQLIFIQLKRRTSYPSDVNKHYKNYSKHLRCYLDEHSIAFFDFSNNKEIQEQHFAGGDHLNREGRELFTRLVAKRIKTLRKPD